MRKFISVILTLCLAMTLFTVASGENDEVQLQIEQVDGTVRPGKAIVLTFFVPEEGTASIRLTQNNDVIQVLMDDEAVEKGMNRIWWNGTQNGEIPESGSYTLEVEQDGDKVFSPVTIGDAAPFFSYVDYNTEVTPEQSLTVNFYASVDGKVTTGLIVNGTWTPISTIAAIEGENTITWTPSNIADGDYEYTITLTDRVGYPSNEEHLPVTISGFKASEEDEEQPDGEEIPDEEAADEENAEELGEVTDEPEELTTDEEEENHEVVLDEPVEGLTQEEMVEEDGKFTPSHGSPYYNEDTSVNYWTLPMDITDEAAVWDMLMQPMTVISGDEKSQTIIRSEPSADSKGVGMVTQETQGVHVISQTDDGWSLIECYSSSFYGTKIKAWNMLVQGYVKTSLLKTVKPQQEYAIVVDKLTQRLYLFKDGKLFSTLLVSTGLTNAKQPFNETRSGEFVLTSAVGDFKSDNMTCGMALRFNSGDLLHEVPSIANKDGSKNYGYTEPKLGEKASHGCIRVQRAKTPEGINMAWLWKNRAKYTKIVIWEDWQGRQIETPADDFNVYYNPAGGRYYHSQETCSSAVGKTFQPLSYGELCDNPEYTKLKPCTSCAPVQRREIIAEINSNYAPGGDHDTVMTEAREKAGY